VETRDARYSDITERLEHVEQTTHDTSQWRQKHTKEFEFTQAEWKDMKGLLAAEKEGRERLKSIFEDRLDGVRKQMMQDSSGSREVVSIGSMNEDLPDRIDEMRTQLQSEKEKRDKHYEGLCKRLFCVERNGGLLDAALTRNVMIASRMSSVCGGQSMATRTISQQDWQTEQIRRCLDLPMLV